MSEPVVTPNSSNHSVPISKTSGPGQGAHSVATESVPPESRPIGKDEHGTTGPDDAPPGAPEGENYPPQLHAGQVGLGPHYAEIHGKDNGLAAKITGLKEQLKGKATHNPELVERGHDRATGELKAKQQAQDDKSPFGAKTEPEKTEGKAEKTDGAPAPSTAPQ